jgi:DNA polymerase-3 subunit gamma/tau
MSLYRKYRPQNFANLVGQDHVRITLTNALKTNNIHHAYLFTGPRGTGKTSTARLLAKAINCENLKEAEPCDSCDICSDINQGRLIDLIEIDAASNRGIDEIRDLREKIQFSPTRAKSKVYIIDEVHMLTKEAFNALLKTLEEPPVHVYFILATTEVHKIPETILSRCQRFDFKRIDNKTLLARLQFIAEAEKIQADPEGLDVIVRSVEGGLRDAIGLLEQLSVNGSLTFAHAQEILGISGKMSLEKLFALIERKEVKAALEEVDALYAEGYDLNQFNKDFLEFLRQQMLESVSVENRQRTAWLLHVISAFLESYENLKHATIPQLPLEMAVIESCFPGVAPETANAQFSVPPVQQPQPEINNQTRAHQKINTAVPESKQQPAASIISAKTGELTLENVKAKWSEVSKYIKNPPVRRLFATSTALGLTGHELTLSFKTSFDLNKMMESANRLDFEEALFQVFGVRFKVKAELDPTPKPADEKAQQLLDVFGGELVEE